MDRSLLLIKRLPVKYIYGQTALNDNADFARRRAIEGAGSKDNPDIKAVLGTVLFE